MWLASWHGSLVPKQKYYFHGIAKFRNTAWQLGLVHSLSLLILPIPRYHIVRKLFLISSSLTALLGYSRNFSTMVR